MTVAAQVRQFVRIVRPQRTVPIMLLHGVLWPGKAHDFANIVLLALIAIVLHAREPIWAPWVLTPWGLTVAAAAIAIAGVVGRRIFDRLYCRRDLVGCFGSPRST
jgi:hypothetical protein